MPNPDIKHGLSDKIIDGVSEAIVVVDSDGVITFVNRAALAMFCYESDEVIGQKVERLIPSALRDTHAAYRQDYMKSPHKRSMGLQLDLCAIRKDDSSFPAEIGLDTVEIDNETFVIAIVTDTTQRKLLEDKLKKSEERWQFALEGSDYGVWDWNVQTGEMYFSGQWKRLLGLEKDNIPNRLEEWETRVHPDDLGTCWDDINNHFDGKTTIYINEHRLRCKDGSYKWFLGRGKLMTRTPDGKPLRMVGTQTDISSQKKAEEILRSAALKDSLTGLSNRRDFMDKFETEANRYRRYGRAFSLVLGDIDFFKNINDTYGHDSGDQVLKRLAEIMTSSLRKQDTVGRWGGEEFIFLMPETDIEGASKSTEKIRKKIAEEPFTFNGTDITVTMSFGICEYENDMKLEDIARAADTRLYKAKSQGRNRVVAEDQG